jgi:hypothetical protein
MSTEINGHLLTLSRVYYHLFAHILLKVSLRLTSHQTIKDRGVMARFSWVYLSRVTDQIYQIPMDWSPSHLMSIPSLRSQPQTTFAHGRDRFVFSFVTDAGTRIGVTSILSSKSNATLTPQSLFIKYTTTRLALRCCFAPAVGLPKGMS